MKTNFLSFAKSKTSVLINHYSIDEFQNQQRHRDRSINITKRISHF